MRRMPKGKVRLCCAYTDITKNPVVKIREYFFMEISERITDLNVPKPLDLDRLRQALGKVLSQE